MTILVPVENNNENIVVVLCSMNLSTKQCGKNRIRVEQE